MVSQYHNAISEHHNMFLKVNVLAEDYNINKHRNSTKHKATYQSTAKTTLIPKN